MRVGVVVFPGSTCERDAFSVVREVLGEEALFLWHQDSALPPVDAVILPGGFSYGDYLRAGAIARFSPIMKAVAQFASSGGLVLGICNGFQILLEAGLLPGAMLRNRSLTFLCQDVSLRVENHNTPFTSRYARGHILTMPIAHAEGNYCADEKTLQDLEEHHQILFRYCTNPNGSLRDIAGICNRMRNVAGMMPHPERSSEAVLGSSDGRLVFESMKAFLQKT